MLQRDVTVSIIKHKLKMVETIMGTNWKGKVLFQEENTVNPDSPITVKL